MVKAVIFDFDGTLVDFKNTDIECLKLILKKTGVPVKPDAFVESAISHILSFHKLVDSGEENPLNLNRYRLFHTFSDFGISWDTTFVNCYKQFLLERTTPYKRISDILSYLHGKVKLGILTNAYNPVMQTKRIQASGLSEFFNEIQISGEEKYAKPDPEAFHIICNRLNSRPEECIFIGDSPKYDISGAIAAGLQTILIQKENTGSTVNPDYRVDCIEEIEPILKKIIA